MAPRVTERTRRRSNPDFAEAPAIGGNCHLTEAAGMRQMMAQWPNSSVREGGSAAPAVDWPLIENHLNLFVDFHIVHANVIVYVIAHHAGRVWGLDGAVEAAAGGRA